MNRLETCQTKCVHQESVELVLKQLPKTSTLEELSRFFKVIGDETRTKILSLLSITPLCVCDIAYLLKISQSAISHQLKVLREYQLVTTEKKGTTIYYSLADHHVVTLFSMGLDHILEGGKQ